jgi:phosphate ABC transporter phosphate-binding protein
LSNIKLKLRKQTFIGTLFILSLFTLSAVAVIPPVEASNAYVPASLSVGGSTLAAPLFSALIPHYTASTGNTVNVNYQAVGSGSGTSNALSAVFNAGMSDAPIPANGLATLDAQGDVTSPANSPPGPLAGADPLIQIPFTIAPVAIFYNIPSFRKTLNLTGDVIAEIFLLHITAWNDPHILALNPGLSSGDIAKLAANPISVVHRSDGSGTSFALTYYFGQVDNGNWTGAGFKAGSTSASNFPASELSAKGTGGVAGLVSATNGAIGYGETSYAIGAGLVYAAVQNADGTAFVLPLSANAAAAAAAYASQLLTNPTFVITNGSGTNVYPISTMSFIFVWSNQNLGTSGGQTWTQGLAFDLVSFLTYVVTQGQAYATDLQYAPLPPALVQIDIGLISKINYGGQSFLAPTTTSVTCNHSSVVVGKLSVSCTAVVSGTGLTGNLLWSSSDLGTFSKTTCAVPKSGKCVSIFKTGGTSSSEAITALFAGDLTNAPSIATASLTVTQATSKVTLLCKPSLVASESTTTCTASVIGFKPSGTVTVSQTGGTGSISAGGSCTLAPKGKLTTTSTCTVSLTGSSAGTATLTASYKGDANNAASTLLKPYTLKVH